MTMWETNTIDFSLLSVPLGKDITGMFVKSLRKYELKFGFYYSTEGSYFFHQKGALISRKWEIIQVWENSKL